MADKILGKKELVDAIAGAIGSTNKDAETALVTVIDTIKTAVKNGDKVRLVGFGTFERRARSARMGVNPRTGDKVSIAASKAPAFKAGKGFKDEVNGK